ncbi:thioredoxin family protein [Galbibacter sp. BG1]|uniref:TlpA family protein disulfide reductase n=1 Tax=Galbibacter sp. BG1 TaxID=1170699 RepID=UPI0015BA7B36|nr:thioredoxin family protein [Galbibacter sp. BG1]QLE00225.1 thioredoxin family protein [Galbibacter sp. BG1]
MKKYILLSFSIITLLSCKTKAQKETAVSAADTKEIEEVSATSEEQEVQEEILVGKHTREDLTVKPYNEWFESGYKEYEPKETVVKDIKSLAEGVKVKIFMGTWCSDSQREVPHFLKIMDEANYSYEDFELIMMTRDKTTPENLEKGLNITNVPTIIFYKNGEEINRIVEYSIETLEEDILAILKGEDYKNAYAD